MFRVAIILWTSLSIGLFLVGQSAHALEGVDIFGLCKAGRTLSEAWEQLGNHVDSPDPIDGEEYRPVVEDLKRVTEQFSDELKELNREDLRDRLLSSYQEVLKFNKKDLENLSSQDQTSLVEAIGNVQETLNEIVQFCTPKEPLKVNIDINDIVLSDQILKTLDSEGAANSSSEPGENDDDEDQDEEDEEEDEEDDKTGPSSEDQPDDGE